MSVLAPIRAADCFDTPPTPFARPATAPTSGSTTPAPHRPAPQLVDEDEDSEGSEGEPVEEDGAVDPDGGEASPGFGDDLDDDDELDEFDDIDEDDFDDEFDDDFEEELEDDYEIEINDEISAEFGLGTGEDDDEPEELDDFEDFEEIE